MQRGKPAADKVLKVAEKRSERQGRKGKVISI